MMLDQRSALSSYMTRLLSEGSVVFTAAQAQKALRIGKGALLDTAERQQRRKYLISPRRGFYIIVPPQFLALGAPPPSWYIDSLMRHENRPYYVALLKAAELHGATHQAVMEFQIITDKRLPRIRAGRSSIVFYYRKNMDDIASGLEDHKTDTGSMKVSCLELTILDLLRYRHAGGGLNHVATVLADLGERIDAARLAALSSAFERSVVQRLGHLLGRLNFQNKANLLYESVLQGPVLPWIELEPRQATDSLFAPAMAERDDRWRVIMRRPLEPDT